MTKDEALEILHIGDEIVFGGSYSELWQRIDTRNCRIGIIKAFAPDMPEREEIAGTIAEDTITGDVLVDVRKPDIPLYEQRYLSDRWIEFRVILNATGRSFVRRQGFWQLVSGKPVAVVFTPRGPLQIMA